MDKALRIVREQDVLERVLVAGKVGEAVVGGGGNSHRPLPPAALQPDDDVLLQHIVVPEGFVARLEQVQVADGGPFQQKVAERAVVGAVAEAARNDRHDLAARRHQQYRQRDKCRVQVDRLDADLTHQQTVTGSAADFLVRRVEDGVGKARLPELHPVDCGLDEVAADDLEPQRQLVRVAEQSVFQVGMEAVVQFEGRHLDVIAGQRFRNAAFQKGARQRANAGTGIQQLAVAARRRKKPGHERGGSSGRKKLAQVRFLRRLGGL